MEVTKIVAIIIVVCIFLVLLSKFPNWVLIVGAIAIALWIIGEIYMFWRDDYDGRW